MGVRGGRRAAMVFGLGTLPRDPGPWRHTRGRGATPILGMGTPRPASEATEDRNRIQKNPLFLGLLK